jgi:hypothetical protein
MILFDAAASACAPNVIVPKQMREALNPLRPSLIISIRAPYGEHNPIP